MAADHGHLAGRAERQVQGILGEDFLEQSDLLIDNDKQRLVLDETPQLEDSLKGEHLPMERSGIFNALPTAHKQSNPDLRGLCVGLTVLVLIRSKLSSI
jgi:hypothetical protein